MWGDFLDNRRLRLGLFHLGAYRFDLGVYLFNLDLLAVAVSGEVRARASHCGKCVGGKSARSKK